MPRGYEKLRDKFIRQGMKVAAAKEKAAKIWNARMAGTGKTVGKGRK